MDEKKNMNEPAKVEKKEENIVSNNPNLNQKVDASSPKVVPSKKGNNFKYVMTVFLFIALFAIVFFLPEISEGIRSFQEKPSFEKPKQEILTSGLMNCTLKKTTGAKEVSTVIGFYFTDKQLKKTTQETSTVLKETATGEELAALETSISSCEKLSTLEKEIAGLTTTCTSTGLSLTMTETVDYQEYDKTTLQDNIAEFEGNIPQFQFNQDINELQSLMQASGYQCEIQ